MTHASLFSGIGGPEVAAAMLGWNNLFHCEINEFGRKVLDYWFPNSKSYEDITKTDFSEWRGKVDVLTGGFPCQPFSYAGKRRGADDDRYLWPYMFKAIDAIRPAWIVAENVAGITTMVEQGEVSEMGGQASMFEEVDDIHRYRLEETFTLQRICDDLESHGYSVQPVLIPACAVGAPHRRDRVFIVARRIASDTDNRADRRTAREDEGKGGEERIQERHEVRKPDEPNQVRREGEGLDIADPGSCGQSSSELESERAGQTIQQQGGEQSFDGISRPSDARITPQPDSHRGCEVDEHMESELADGAKPVSNGGQRNVADTESVGRFDGDRQGRRDILGRQDMAQAERSVDASVSDGQPQSASDTRDAGFQEARAEQQSAGTWGYALRSGEWVERLQGLGVAGCERWDGFPSVSPVHRGNDGLPFNVDDLTIHFNEWRNESLKAYGNAIVPQVMYEIFRFIEIVEKGVNE